MVPVTVRSLALQFRAALETLSLKQQGQQNCRYTISGQNMTGWRSVCSEDLNRQEHPGACGHMEKGLICRPFCYSFQKNYSRNSKLCLKSL